MRPCEPCGSCTLQARRAENAVEMVFAGKVTRCAGMARARGAGEASSSRLRKGRVSAISRVARVVPAAAARGKGVRGGISRAHQKYCVRYCKSDRTTLTPRPRANITQDGCHAAISFSKLEFLFQDDISGTEGGRALFLLSRHSPIPFTLDSREVYVVKILMLSRKALQHLRS